MKLQLLFDQPSLRFDEGLPIGNGRLGAIVTGGLPEKHLLLNEETVWYGGPRDRNNPDAIRYMGQIRQLMRAGRVREAQRLAVMALPRAMGRSAPACALGPMASICSNPGNVPWSRKRRWDRRIVRGQGRRTLEVRRP